MSRRTRLRCAAALAAPALAAALLAGCSSEGAASAGSGTPAATAGSAAAGGDNGVADEDADAILAAAQKGLADAESFRVRGAGAAGTERFSIDMGFKPGSGARGTVGVSGQELGLLVTGGKTYVKATGDFLAARGVPKELTQLFKGKWLLFPADGSDRFREFTDGKAFGDAVLDPDGTLTKGEQKDVDGVAAIALVSKGGSPDSGGTLWVATEGTARPLRLEPRAGASTKGALAFTYDVDVDLQPPREDDVVDLSALTGGGGLPGGSAG